jgi:hypothetical protein
VVDGNVCRIHILGNFILDNVFIDLKYSIISCYLLYAGLLHG